MRRVVKPSAVEVTAQMTAGRGCNPAEKIVIELLGPVAGGGGVEDVACHQRGVEDTQRLGWLIVVSAEVLLFHPLRKVYSCRLEGKKFFPHELLR